MNGTHLRRSNPDVGVNTKSKSSSVALFTLGLLMGVFRFFSSWASLSSSFLRSATDIFVQFSRKCFSKADGMAKFRRQCLQSLRVDSVCDFKWAFNAVLKKKVLSHDGHGNLSVVFVGLVNRALEQSFAGSGFLKVNVVIRLVGVFFARSVVWRPPLIRRLVIVDRRAADTCDTPILFLKIVVRFDAPNTLIVSDVDGFVDVDIRSFAAFVVNKFAPERPTTLLIFTKSNRKKVMFTVSLGSIWQGSRADAFCRFIHFSKYSIQLNSLTVLSE